MDEIAALLLGIVLVVLGATAATVTQRRLEQGGRANLAPLALVPFGILIGAGAAIARGWDLVAAIVVGAVLVPIVGVVGRLVEVRRHRRAARRDG
ncbi:MAG: hypothetical protein JJT89_05585 [Nitriliruptoraceae bacterium]|nr:hypothetical protein [Nitriliruptoraceae bacterium]